MALFRGPKTGKGDLLRRIQARDWKSSEERTEVLRELAKEKNFRPDELILFSTSPDSTVRSFGERKLQELLDPKLVDQIFQALETKTSRDQSLMFNSLVRARANLVVPHLARLVSGASKAMSMRAMEALSALPTHEVGKEFVAFLEHEKKEIRYLALVKVHESEGLLDDANIRRKIADLAGDEDERITLRVLDMLAESDAQEAARVSLTLLKSAEPAIQQKAVRVLSQALQDMGSSHETEDQLLGLLTDGSEAVRNGVLDIIMRRPDKERILKKLLVFCKDLMGWMRDRTLVSLRAFATEITQPVIHLMSDPDEDVRSMALMLGSTLEAKEAVPHIVRLLGDDDWWLRMIAAETLGKIGDPRAVEPLVAAMKDADAAMACIEALARIGDPRATGPIAEMLSMPQAEIRLEAIEALVRLGDKRVLPVLQQCAQRDPNPGICERAKIAVERLSGRLTSEAGLGMAALDDEHARPMAELKPLERMLVKIREMGASDLHIVVDAPAIVRMHGVLKRMSDHNYTPAQTRELILAILGPQERDRLERDWQVDLCVTIPGVGRYRTNVYVERKGLSASFRTIPNEVPTLVDIGLPGHLADLVNYHQGLIVVSGPSGSGKSTTLAALVNLFNERRRSHILLLEDPIEFVHPPKGCLINQRQTGKHTRSFASALRGALRQDPDVIVVGEMRDPETVMLAIEASETGHLVIGTMNVTSAPKTIDRIIDNFPVGEQAQVRTMLSETIKAVICQNLLPNATHDGRVALFEIMVGNLGVRNLIKDNKTYQIKGQMQIGEAVGHQTVDTALQKLLDGGRITAEQAWMRAEKKDNFEHRVSADFLAGQTAAS